MCSKPANRLVVLKIVGPDKADMYIAANPNVGGKNRIDAGLTFKHPDYPTRTKTDSIIIRRLSGCRNRNISNN